MESVDALTGLPEITECTPEKRWEKIQMGLFHKFIRFWFKDNLELSTTIILSICMTIMISGGDTFSDMLLAHTLFSQGHWKYGLLVILIDYFPAWQVLLHNISGSTWRNVDSTREKLITIAILVFAPISTPLFQLRWLLKFNTKCEHTFNYLHKNARLSEVICTAFESPMQSVVVLILFSKGILKLPWESNSIVEDSAGNLVNFGAVPGVLSLVMSMISILRAAVDVAEESGWKQQLATAAFSMITAFFRIISYVLIIAYLNEWSVIMFAIMMIASITAIGRFKKEERAGFSVVTSVMLGIFIPCAFSEDPQINMRVSTHRNKTDTHVKNKRILTSKTAMLTVPIILITDMIIWLLLLYSPYFKVVQDVSNVVSNETSALFIIMFLLPNGVMAFLLAFSIRKGELKRKGQFILGLSVIVFKSSAISTLICIGTGKRLTFN